ncbi:hypothetical protein BGX28_010462, partial [Mortierella sp. GBA30]
STGNAWVFFVTPESQEFDTGSRPSAARNLANGNKPLHKEQISSKVFSDRLLPSFRPSSPNKNCKMHFDGSHTEEKALAHAMRLEHIQVHNGELVATTDRELGKITTVLDRVKSPVPPSSSQQSFVVNHATMANSAYKSIR